MKKVFEEKKPRKLVLSISDSDFALLNDMAGCRDNTLEGLLSAFVADLANGDYSHGGDESMYAMNWYNRCLF